MDKKSDLMDGLLHSAAQQAGQNELDEYNSAEGEELDPKTEEKIFRKLRKEQKIYESKGKYSPIAKSLKRVAVILLIVISIGFTCLLSIEATRDALGEAIIRWSEKYIFFKYPNESETVAPTEIIDFKEPVVDEKFERTELYKDPDIFIVEYKYSNHVIVYDQWPIQDFNTYITNMDAELTEIFVGGNKAYKTEIITEETAFYSIIWNDNVYAYSISGTIDFEELLRMAESVK